MCSDMNHHELEEGTKLALDFKKLAKWLHGEDLLPAVRKIMKQRGFDCWL